MTCTFESLHAHFVAEHPARAEAVKQGWELLGEEGRQAWINDAQSRQLPESRRDELNGNFSYFTSWPAFVTYHLTQHYRSWRVMNGRVTSSFKDKISKFQ
jgi:hypothetical protein